MEPNTLQFIQITSFAPAALVLAIVLLKILPKWSALWIARMNKTDTSAQARLDKIQGNDLADLSDFKARVFGIENRLDSMQNDFQKQLGVVGERLSVLEERTRK